MTQIAILITVQPDGGKIRPYLAWDVSVESAVDCAYQVLRDARIPFSAVSGTIPTGENLDVYA